MNPLLLFKYNGKVCNTPKTVLLSVCKTHLQKSRTAMTIASRIGLFTLFLSTL